MSHPQALSPKPSHIRAVFATSAAFFDLPRVATFEDLADRLCRIGERHAGPLTSVEIEAEPSRDGHYVLTMLLRQLAELEDEAPEATRR